MLEISELRDELKSDESTEASNNTQQAPSEKTDFSSVRLDSLKKEADQSKVDEKSKNQLEDIRVKAEARNETPSHQEIMEAYRLGKHETKIDISLSSLNRVWNGEDKNGNKYESIDQVQEIPHGKDYAKFMEKECLGGNNRGEPEIYCKQLTTEEGKFSLRDIPFYKVKEIPTDEALMVVRMNNGDNIDNRTIVIALVKVVNGVPQFDKNHSGIYSTMSEREYLENIQGHAYKKEETYRTIEEQERHGEYKTIEESKKGKSEKPHMNRLRTKFALGEISIADYKEQFRRENGKTLDEHWNQWDKEISNDRAYFTSERLKGEVMARLEGRYQEILQTVNEKLTEITKLEEKQTQEIEKGMIEYLKNPEILMYLDGLDNQTPEIAETCKDILKTGYGLSDETIDILQNKRTGAILTLEWTNSFKSKHPNLGPAQINIQSTSQHQRQHATPRQNGGRSN